VWGSSRRRLAAARDRAAREAAARRRAHDEVADLQARIRIHAAARRIAERGEERARAELVATLRRLATLQDAYDDAVGRTADGPDLDAAGAREAARRNGGGR
jgi:uncharacterized protein YhaN